MAVGLLEGYMIAFVSFLRLGPFVVISLLHALIYDPLSLQLAMASV